MTQLPDKIHVTNWAWSEEACAYKVQLGTDERSIAYAWVPGGSGDAQAREQALAIAQRLCEGWNTRATGAHMAALEAENARLREIMFGAAETTDDQVTAKWLFAALKENPND